MKLEFDAKNGRAQALHYFLKHIVLDVRLPGDELLSNVYQPPKRFISLAVGLSKLPVMRAQEHLAPF